MTHPSCPKPLHRELRARDCEKLQAFHVKPTWSPSSREGCDSKIWTWTSWGCFGDLRQSHPECNKQGKILRKIRQNQNWAEARLWKGEAKGREPSQLCLSFLKTSFHGSQCKGWHVGHSHEQHPRLHIVSAAMGNGSLFPFLFQKDQLVATPG
jgi:hypothetical protein